MTEKKKAIMQATLKLVAERGLHNTPTSLIARHAGVAEGTTFRHFTSKENLLREVFDWRLAEMRKCIVQHLDHDMDMYDQFVAMCESLLDFYLEHKETYFFVENYLGSVLGRSLRHEMLFNEEIQGDAPVMSLIQQGVAEGVLKPLPKFAVSALIFGPIYFYFEEVFCHDLNVEREIYRQIVDSCWSSIARNCAG